MNYAEFKALLCKQYDPREAEAIARLVMEDRFGLTLTDLALGKDSVFSLKERDELRNIAQMLVSGIPVQQVLGHATFCGRPFEVTPDVLIPRPETEDLVQWVLKDITCHDAVRAGTLTVADLGTGSGCIAVSISLELMKTSQPHNLIAVDVSPKALDVARRNAERLGADVVFQQQDMLDIETSCRALPVLDCIVSNPPYVLKSEAAAMAQHVLAHEPHLALFVPDADPLRFYRAIAQIGLQRLYPGGLVYVELNSALAKETSDLFEHFGYTDLTLRNDQFGRPRMLRAKKDV